MIAQKMGAGGFFCRPGATFTVIPLIIKLIRINSREGNMPRENVRIPERVPWLF